MGSSYPRRARRSGSRPWVLVLLVLSWSLIATPNPVERAASRHRESGLAGLAAPPHRGTPSASKPPLGGAAAHPDQLSLSSHGHVVAFRPESVLVASGSHLLRAEFVNAQPAMPIRNTAPQQAAGTGTAGSESYTYRQPWPGIDVVYEATPAGIVESTFQLAPGADAGAVRVRYNVPVALDSSGALRWRFETGELIESAPRAWEERNGQRVGVAVAFRVLGDREVGLALGAYDPAVPLVIDPVLRWHTFLGSSDSDEGTGIAVDGRGKAYVTGFSHATWGSPVNGHAGDRDAFVAALDATTGARLWHTFLGSSGDDIAYCAAVDGTGRVYVTGYSGGTWGTPVDPHTGSVDAFVAALDAATGARLWHTFLGSLSGDVGYSIAADGSGKVYAAGASWANWGAPVNAYSGSVDAFVAALDAATGARLWHTFLGSSSDDRARSIAVDGTGKLYLTGSTSATWGSPVDAYAGNVDAFVAAVDAATGARLWHTFLGSSGDDEGYGIAVDRTGKVCVTGVGGGSWGSPVNPFAGGSQDAFVATLSAATGNRLWNTFLGSSSYDYGRGITVDGTGKVYVTGESNATWGSPLNPFAGGSDAFVAALDAATGGRLWHSFLGSSNYEEGAGIAVDGTGELYVTGYAYGTWGSPVNPYVGAEDAFVARLDAASARALLPAGDFDGDHKADVAVFRPAQSAWYLRSSGNGQSIGYTWGGRGDLPVPGDYDADGKTDIAVFRPSDGGWYVVKSNGGILGVAWGTAGDIPVPADYDGDGKTDLAVFRPSQSAWYVLKSSGGQAGLSWGGTGDVPVPADYDGDGKADIAVFRPSDSGWYIVKSSTGGGIGFTWGTTGDVPVFGDFDGDGKADAVVFRESDGGWYVLKSSGGSMGLAWGTVGDLPV